AGSGGTAGTSGGTAGASGTTGNGGSQGGAGTTGTAGSSQAGTGGSGTGGSGTGVTVNLGATRQTIEGFGLNTALSSAVPNWDQFYTATGTGLGLSIVRVAMQPNGSLSGAIPPASYNAKVIGSPWSAPAADKDNNNTQKGGHLKTTSYESWATKIANFASTNKLYAMGASNEPDFASCGSSIGPPCYSDYDTMVFTANEMVNFVKVLGPKLKANGVKLIAPEPSEWIHLWSNASATGSTVAGHPNSSDPLKCGCFSNTPTTTGCASKCATGDGYDYGHFLAKDATAWGLIDIIGTHEYDTQKAEAWPADVDGGKRSKTIYETEVSGVHYWPNEGPSSDIANGVVVAEWIHSAVVVGEASAWLYWWYQASGDNEGLIISTSSLTKRAYTLGNYAKFVRPGYVMVDITGNSNASLLLSAFKNTDGTVVVVAVNKGSAAATVPITISGGTAPTMCTPNVTSSSANLTAGTPVTVTGGTFSASLAATTVTSFVCK
ncbi:MAG TPA: glycoside hydrolase family 30 beta sandwich domain-containing protein, partial [Ilumatobacteraceae bacterium]|nr:glycoside hydrolase family 30 beta sandwich domain-containing protein [Ilumatobacteraceae bacterium]